MRVMPQAPQITPRDFAPDAEGLQRAQLAGITIGKEIADLSLAGDRLKVEKAKLKATEEEIKFNQQLSQTKLRQAIADAQASENRLDPMKELDSALLQTGVDPAIYGNNRDRKLLDAQRIRQRNTAFQADPTLTPAMLQQRFGQTLAEEMSGPGALAEVTVAETVDAPVADTLASVQVATPSPAPAQTLAPEFSAADDALAQFEELKSYRDRMVPEGTTPLQVATSLFQQDNPSRPLGALSASERTAALKPYLEAAQSEVVSRNFVSNGNSYKVDIRQSKDGQFVYEVSEPLLQRTAPETTATATVRNKLAFLEESDQRLDALLKKVADYKTGGAFGLYDTAMAVSAANPNALLPVRAVASFLGNPSTKQLVGELAAVGAKTMTELAGSAQTAGEAARLGPYVPTPSDVILGPEQLQQKLESFRKELRRSKDAIKIAFGIDQSPKAATAPETPAAPAQGEAQQKAAAAIESYRNRRAKAQ